MRSLSTAVVSAITSSNIQVALGVSLTFVSGVYNVFSGVGSLTFNGETWNGVGDLGKVGGITEAAGITASGTSVTLSGIDNTLLTDSLADIGGLLPASIWLLFFNQGQVTGSVMLWSGVVDKATIQVGTDTSTITLALETRMLSLRRSSALLWTDEAQRQIDPNDTSLRLVNLLQNATFLWQ